MFGCVVAAPSSGAGKTTVSLGLLAAFRRRGLAVQPFKVGPDYIDTAHHTAAVERPSVNLDPVLTSEEFVRETFAHHARGCDAVIVEGVMGLFDGAGTGDRASTAHIAKLLGLPVLLVVDAHAVGRTAAATVMGCEQFDPEMDVRGVILNGVAGGFHLSSIVGAVRDHCRSRVVGHVPTRAELRRPERQLGLVSVFENGLEEEWLARLADLLEETVDLTAIEGWRIMLPEAGPTVDPRPSFVRVAVARDETFCFHYEDNLRLLEEEGAELVFFSPLRDPRLPPAVQAIYYPGGFPEEFAAQLAGNRSMIESVGRFRGAILAECGGLMYLCRTLYDANGRGHRMCGLVDGEIEMTDRLQACGYREVTLTRDTILGPAGVDLRGHEFHWSRLRGRPGLGWGVFHGPEGDRGFASGALLASYLHIHFGQDRRWLRRCLERWRELGDEADRDLQPSSSR